MEGNIYTGLFRFFDKQANFTLNEIIYVFTNWWSSY